MYRFLSGYSQIFECKGCVLVWRKDVDVVRAWPCGPACEAPHEPGLRVLSGRLPAVGLASQPVHHQVAEKNVTVDLMTHRFIQVAHGRDKMAICAALCCLPGAVKPLQKKCHPPLGR